MVGASGKCVFVFYVWFDAIGRIKYVFISDNVSFGVDIYPLLTWKKLLNIKIFNPGGRSKSFVSRDNRYRQSRLMLTVHVFLCV